MYCKVDGGPHVKQLRMKGHPPKICSMMMMMIIIIVIIIIIIIIIIIMGHDLIFGRYKNIQ